MASYEIAVIEEKGRFRILDNSLPDYTCPVDYLRVKGEDESKPELSIYRAISLSKAETLSLLQQELLEHPGVEICFSRKDELQEHEAEKLNPGLAPKKRSLLGRLLKPSSHQEDLERGAELRKDLGL